MRLKDCDYKFFHRELKIAESFKPFPHASERNIWDKLLKTPLNKARRKYITEMAERLNPADWKR